MRLVQQEQLLKRLKKRRILNAASNYFFMLMIGFALVCLSILLIRIFSQGIGYISFDFFQNFASRIPENAGIKAALIGSLCLMAITGPLAIILGIGTAIYLVEYAKETKVNQFIQMNIANLAGVPSIIFGLLGLTIFVRLFDLGKSLLAAGFTMTLLILPIIIVATQEALKAVSQEQRDASYAMGATKWQTIVHIVVPAALPSMLTGCILACSRAIGETAPLVVIGIPVILQFLPTDLLSTFTTLPMQIFDWAKRPQEQFQYVAAAGIIVLMLILIAMNSIAIFIRYKMQKKQKG